MKSGGDLEGSAHSLRLICMHVQKDKGRIIYGNNIPVDLLTAHLYVPLTD